MRNEKCKVALSLVLQSILNWFNMHLNKKFSCKFFRICKQISYLTNTRTFTTTRSCACIPQLTPCCGHNRKEQLRSNVCFAYNIFHIIILFFAHYSRLYACKSLVQADRSHYLQSILLRRQGKQHSSPLDVEVKNRKFRSNKLLDEKPTKQSKNGGTVFVTRRNKGALEKTDNQRQRLDKNSHHRSNPVISSNRLQPVSKNEPPEIPAVASSSSIESKSKNNALTSYDKIEPFFFDVPSPDWRFFSLDKSKISNPQLQKTKNNTETLPPRQQQRLVANLDNDVLSITIDSSSAVSLVSILWLATRAFFGRAVLGTMLTVLPLYIGQKIANFFILIPIQDWYTGRFMRITYKTLEQQYKTAYSQIFPTTKRSLGRILIHVTILFTIGRIVESLLGLQDPTQCMFPGQGGCYWWCGIAWLSTVISTGHAASSAIAIWGPLKVHLMEDDDNDDPVNDKDAVSAHNNMNGRSHWHHRPNFYRIFRRPWTVIHFVLDPDQWFREIVEHDRRRRRKAAIMKPAFDPDPRMFPVTWSFVRILQMIAVAKEMYSSQSIMHSFMKQVLIEQAFSDEWYRVFIVEKRIGLGSAVMIGYMISAMNLMWKVIGIKSVPNISGISFLFILPSVLAIIVSAWMNVLVLFNRNSQTNNNNASTKHKQTTMQQSHYVKEYLLGTSNVIHQTLPKQNNYNNSNQHIKQHTAQPSMIASMSNNRAAAEAEARSLNLFSRTY